MAILRSRALTSDVHHLANPAVERSLAQVEERVARAKLDGQAEGRAQAERELRPKVQEAERRAADQIKAAEEKARQQVAAADQALHARLDGAIAALESTVTRIAGLEAQLVAQAEADVLQLGLRLAATILRRETVTDPAWQRALIEHGIGRLPDRRRIEVRLHPEDAAAVRERRLAIARAADVDQLELNDDPGLVRGGCIISCQGTRIDASLDACWDRLTELVTADAPTPNLAMDQTGAEVDNANPVEATAEPGPG